MIHTQRANIKEVLQTFRNTTQKLKVKLDITQFNIGDVDPRKSIDYFLANIEKAAGDCNLLFIAIPNCLKTQYKRIKDYCLFNVKRISQIACEGTLGKKNVQSIATKILLQIIAKKGNILWVPVTPK